jgi:sugar phosphate isomerase/epimerase
MFLHQAAVQLYTVRESCTNESDLARTMDRICAIGYQAVQVSGVSQDIPSPKIKNLLEERRLACCATHENGDMIRRSPAAVADRLETLECTITAYPWPAGVDFDSDQSVASLIADLDRAGAVLAARGRKLCYHHHAHEFYRREGRTILERIFAETDPAHLAAELDTFWIQAGGCDPVTWITKFKGRLPIVHLKDYRVRSDGSRDYAEIGSGNLDWPGIISACDDAGVHWFCVEQDECPGDPFDSLRQSLDFIRTNLLS